jgi:hypothetical protein
MRWMFGLLLSSIIALSTGCGGGDSLATVPVKGKVLIDNAGVPGIKVTFIPDLKTKGPQGFGFTDAEGNYEIGTAQGVKGLVAGDYKVIMNKLSLKKGGDVDPSQGGAVAQGDTVDEIARVYSDPELSQLTAKVDANSKPFEFGLTSPKKKK